MENKIRIYVHRLFRDLEQTESLKETKEELTANLNEKYQDLLRDGFTEEQAYQRVIASIGDVDELIDAEAVPPKVEKTIVVKHVPQKRSTTKTVLWGLLAVFLIGNIILIFGNFNPQDNKSIFNFGSNSARASSSSRSIVELQKEEIDLTDVQSIQIDGIEVDLRIAVDDSQSLKFTYFNKEGFKDLLVNKSGSNLRIQQQEEGNYDFGLRMNRNQSARIEIVIPQNMDIDYAFNTVSGEVYIPEIEVEKTTIGTVSGDVYIQKIKAQTSKINTVSGDVKIDYFEGALNIETVSGDVDADDILGSVDISTTSGDVDISRFTIVEKSYINTLSGDVEIRIGNSEDDIQIAADTLSGDIDSKYPLKSRDQDVILEIDTMSGEIDVE